jgi:hypothetical protein
MRPTSLMNPGPAAPALSMAATILRLREVRKAQGDVAGWTGEAALALLATRAEPDTPRSIRRGRLPPLTFVPDEATVGSRGQRPRPQTDRGGDKEKRMATPAAQARSIGLMPAAGTPFPGRQ